MSVITLFGTDGTVIAMDCVENIGMSRSAEVSSSTTFFGNKVSDNYRANLPTIPLSGLVSTIKTGNNSAHKTPEMFRKLMDKLMDNEVLIRGVPDMIDNAFPILNNMVIADYHIDRDVTIADSLRVQLTLQSLDISRSVQKTKFINPSKDTSGSLASSSGKPVAGKTTEKTPEVRETVARQLGLSVVDILNPAEPTLP